MNDQTPNELVLTPLPPPQQLPGRIRRGAGRVQVRAQPAVRSPVYAARGQRRRGRPIVRRPPPHQILNEDATEG